MPTILSLMMLLKKLWRTLSPSSLALVTLLVNLEDLLVRVRVLRKPLRMLLKLVSTIIPTLKMT
ncbi:hypothetical protein, conserved [Babesia bigemina]|uniref:Uncharacterized protein n=1 Tax=Babesia bigemina TaxID=5866 RepID=A0A061BK28_BABBI|nr:hypothetical protein, conserved [Babesia bigemina]CDR71840.1 hypothetical protein, conserved [Babesia bigemina]|eukprot:XP_012770783.1 hypothetical protein, conserved [Babesia bigemina]